MVHTRNVRVLMFPTDSSATPLLVLLPAAATAIGLQVPATDTLDSAAPSEVRTTLADAVQLRLLLLKLDETVRELTAMLCRGAAGGAGLGEGLLCWKGGSMQQQGTRSSLCQSLAFAYARALFAW